MTLTDRRSARPPLPENAGKNTIQLDLARTRDELAVSLSQLVAKLNPKRLMDDHPVGLLLAALGLFTVLGSVIVHATERKNDV